MPQTRRPIIQKARDDSDNIRKSLIQGGIDAEIPKGMEDTRGLKKSTETRGDINKLMKIEAESSSEIASSSTPTEFYNIPQRGPPEEH